MPTNLLSDKTIKSKLAEARRTGAPVRVVDGDGLYLEAQPNGKGWWRLRYWLHGREGRMSLGTYPDVPRRPRRSSSSGPAASPWHLSRSPAWA